MLALKTRYPCRDCEERHFACWDRCEAYQEAKAAAQQPKDEADVYKQSKGKFYKTQYGWRR